MPPAPPSNTSTFYTYHKTSKFIFLSFSITSSPRPQPADHPGATVAAVRTHGADPKDLPRSLFMATEQQIAANRRNAQLSTGPRSVEGKAASSRNALKTGLYTRGIIVGSENPDQLAELEAAYTAEYAPATPTERALVDSLIHYEWLLRRYRWVETEVWRASLDRMSDYQRRESWAGNAFMDTPAISRIHRLRNQTQRLYHETLDKLKALQSERQPAPHPDPDPEPVPQPIEIKPAPAEIGFVPSNRTLRVSSASSAPPRFWTPPPDAPSTALARIV